MKEEDEEEEAGHRSAMCSIQHIIRMWLFWQENGLYAFGMLRWNTN